MIYGKFLTTVAGADRLLSFFFFQAEDGIRDYKVTGVQTCALPIFTARSSPSAATTTSFTTPGRRRPRAATTPRSEGRCCSTASCGKTAGPASATAHRSEERRVGKEGRSRGAPDH